VASGLTATMIESPLDVQRQLSGKIPADHLKACDAGKAGNTVDLFDLRGENTSPGPLPAGFEARGIVALVFSCLAAFLGMATIGWYGMRPIKSGTG
jgi:iron transport multicopper oxidase